MALRILSFLLVIGAIACGEGPVGVPDLEEVEATCRLPAELALEVDSTELSPVSLRPALAHAATVMIAALDQSPQLTALQRSLELLTGSFGSGWEPDCRRLGDAWASFAALPPGSEPQPDRDAIGFLFALAASSLFSTRH